MVLTGNTKEKWGLCFAGGGGKGAYEIGVWKALAENSMMNFHAVSGSSVGALNAVLFSTMTINEAEQIWKEITPDKLLELKPDTIKHFINDIIMIHSTLYANLALHAMHKSNLLSKIFIHSKNPTSSLNYIIEEGMFSREGLKNILEKSGVLDKLNTSKVECYAAICNLKILKSQMEYLHLNNMPKDEILNVLLASSALPFVYGAQKVNGKKYRDGGLKDNVPIAPLYSCGCTHIISIRLDQLSKKRQKEIIGYNKNFVLSKYQDAYLLEIYPSRNLKGLLGTLNFSPDNIQKLITFGYEDTKACLNSIISLQPSHTMEKRKVT